MMGEIRRCGGIKNCGQDVMHERRIGFKKKKTQEKNYPKPSNQKGAGKHHTNKLSEIKSTALFIDNSQCQCIASTTQ